MPAIYETRLIVKPDAIDPQRHVHNLTYLQWLQNAAIAHSTEQGWSPQAYRERQWAWVVRSHFVEYKRPARSEDQLVIRTWVSDMKKFTSLRKYEILFDASGKQVVKAETNWAFVNSESESLIPIPHDVSSCFEIVD